jgi:hypothetical protein
MISSALYCGDSFTSRSTRVKVRRMAVSKRSLHLNRPPHVLCIVSLFNVTPIASEHARTLTFTFTYSHAWALRSRLLSRTSHTYAIPEQASARYRSLLPCYNIAPGCPCVVDTSFATFFFSSFPHAPFLPSAVSDSHSFVRLRTFGKAIRYSIPSPPLVGSTAQFPFSAYLLTPGNRLHSNNCRCSPAITLIVRI